MRKSFKEILVLILSAALVFGVLPVAAFAAASGTCGSGVTWTFNDNRTLAINGSGDMTNYTNTTVAPWGEFSSQITKVTVADCENDQTAKYVATVSFGGTDYTGETAVFTVENTRLNHKWQLDYFEWAADCHSAEAMLVCANDPEHVTWEPANISEVRMHATCEADAFTVYTATYDGHSEDKTVTEENTKLNHNYQFDSFEWSRSGKTAEAKLICANDPTHVTFVWAEMSEAQTPAACEADAFTVYTATYGAHTEDNTVTEENTKLNHNYQFDSFVWAEDGKTAKAKLVCSNDPAHVIYEAAEMSEAKTDATCEDDAFIVNTATYGEHTEDNTVIEDDTKLGHLFTNYVYQNDASCTRNGTETAVCDRKGCDATHTREAADTALGHTYGEPAWEWESEDLAKATFACGACDSVVTVSAKAADGQISREVVSEATADADGLARYTATVTLEGRTYTDTFDKAIPAGTPDQPDTPDDPDPTDPTEDPAGEKQCKWCGEVHTGIWGKLVGFFHGILYFFAHLFGRR